LRSLLLKQEATKRGY